MTCDIRAERKPCQREWPCAGALRYNRQHVIGLTTPFVIGACTFAHAAKVKAHGLPPALNKGTRQRLHHLVVHGAAKLGMRVRNDRYTLDGLPGCR